MYAQLVNTGFLVLALTAQCLGQQIKVAQGGNQIDGSTWVTLTIPTQNSYQVANGGFTPSLTVRCNSGKKGKPGEASILLDSGGVQPRTPSNPGGGSVLLMPPKENQLRLLREDLFFRMRLDDNKPERREWTLLPSSDTVYKYSGQGEGMMGFGATWLYPRLFLQKVLTTKILMIEFQPFGQDNLFVSEFHLDGLNDEFQRHQECGVK